MTCRLPKPAVLPLLALAVIVSAPSANAGHNSPLSRSADCYREAVLDFERLVFRNREIDSHHKRLTDDLEDSTSRLRSAARDERRPDRTYARFAETRAYHSQVENVFFSGRFYPLYPELEACWAIVNEKYYDLCSLVRTLPRDAYRGARPDFDRVYRSHSYSGPRQQSFSPPSYEPPARYNPDPFYRSEYTPTFRSENLGPRPAIDYTRTRGYSSATVNVGALLQRIAR